MECMLKTYTAKGVRQKASNTVNLCSMVSSTKASHPLERDPTTLRNTKIRKRWRASGLMSSEACLAPQRLVTLNSPSHKLDHQKRPIELPKNYLLNSVLFWAVTLFSSILKSQSMLDLVTVLWYHQVSNFVKMEICV